MTRHETNFRSAPPTGDHFRREVVLSSEFDEAAMTVEAIASTFADVQRRDGKGIYIERLDPSGLDTTSINGAPLLDGHRQGRAADVIGIIKDHRIEAGKLVVTLRLSSAEDAAPSRTRIREKMVRLSIGYRVLRWAESVDPGTKLRVRTAAAWQIFEVSAVPVPADAGSVFRDKGVTPMEEDVIDAPEAVEAARRKAVRTICRTAGMTAEQADELIDAGADETAARAAAYEHMTARQPVRIRTTVGVDHTDPAAIRTRREEAIYARVAGVAPEPEAREFMDARLVDHARASLEVAGVSTRGMTADDIFTRAHGTTDFPELLTGVGRRILVSTYTAAESPLKQLARSTTLSDFRPVSKLKLSETGPLQKLSEHGEIKHTIRSEVKEAYALDTYASMFAITRQALVNDDLGAFNDWGAQAGRAAAETEANVLFSLLTANSGAGPRMGEDNKTLFHADHGNIATGTEVGDPTDVAAFAAARVRMRRQKGLDGKTPINVTPKFLLVRPEDETDAERLLAKIYAATTDDANPFTGKFVILVEPRMTGKAWYLFADPAQAPVLEYAYLSGAPGPQIATQAGWNTLGMEFRVYLDFGAGAVDFRGAYRNAGE